MSDQTCHTAIKRKTACNRDCPDACGIVATIENGRVVRLQGDPDHPITRGFLCRRTSRFLDRQYDPARITSPMVRQNGTWQNTSWDAALDLAAERLLHYRTTLGPASVMNYRCGGSMGIMKSVTDYFFQEFGPVTVKSGDVCSGAGEAAQMMDFGVVDSNDIFDIYNAKTIFLWGKNVYVSQVHLLPVLKEAKSRGARLVLIDPVRHRTASLCHQFAQVKPGGDAAVAFGIALWMLTNDLLDPAAKTYCDHWDAYCDLISSRSMAQWSLLAGISTRELENLAESYADGPTTTLVGWGMQRRVNGAAMIRAIDALAAVSGNVGRSGSGVSFYFPRRGAFDLSFVDVSLAPRRIPEPLLGPAIESASNPPIEMIWITAGNPVAMMPQSKTVARALRDRFTVVVDSFMTDTAECADVFLPTTTMLEDDDLLGAYGHHWISDSPPVIAPPAGVKTDYEILAELAPRVGVAGWFTDGTETWKRRLLTDLKSKGVTLEHLQGGAVKNPDAAEVLFAERRFATPSGKVNLITQYNHPQEKVNSNYPLQLMALSTEAAQSSQWPSQVQVGPATLTVHPQTANGFNDGDIVTLQSSIDQIPVRLKFDSKQRLDVALMDKGGWMSAQRCANALIEAELTDDGQCAVYYDTPVRITRNRD